ncbi:hypothetical protein SAMN05216266_11285 [Amycolatopsis marina]|uniref:Uncharacterized protein n=1 Tax=Amycolatopsis marina TaxID=490629 RepID=A0A1I1B5Y4_9PSEU|nr:hypothetical protein [Amycolatopsis marina]SFB45681.1 hypothetical protein SAMN05216266_11285 [Amycolatopsis marina]
MSQVPVWVPIVVAALGFVGVVTSQLIAGWREDRRWRREAEREDLRWRRERQRDWESRSFDGRVAGYSEIIGPIEAFDWVLFRARRVVESGAGLDEHLATDLRGVSHQARNSLGAVNLHSPERIRVRLREAMIPRVRLSTRLLDGERRDDLRELWDTGQREYRLMRAEMRRDLGLDAEELPEVV